MKAPFFIYHNCLLKHIASTQICHETVPKHGRMLCEQDNVPDGECNLPTPYTVPHDNYHHFSEMTTVDGVRTNHDREYGSKPEALVRMPNFLCVGSSTIIWFYQDLRVHGLRYRLNLYLVECKCMCCESNLWLSGWCRYYVKRTRLNPLYMLDCTYALPFPNPHNVGK